MARLGSFILSLIMIISISTQASFAKDALKICNSGEWPPYFFHKRHNNVVDTSSLVGITIDLLDTVFEKINRKYQFDIIPWKRCLRDVGDFDQFETYEMTTDLTLNEDRAKKLLYTNPIYQTNIHAYYSHSNLGSTQIKSVKDLNRYRVCGILGYNYDYLYKAGFEGEIDDRATNLKQVFGKIMAGRCDFSVDSHEIVIGNTLINSLKIPEDIKNIKLPDIPKTNFYFVISKKSPRAELLLEEINNALDEIKKSGIEKDIYKKYNIDYQN